MSFSVFWDKVGLYFNVETEDGFVTRAFFSDKPVFGEEVKEQYEYGLREKLESYFSGKRIDLSCRVKLNVTPFVRKVLSVTSRIPYGSVASYAEVASAVKSSPRAVGQALKRNPVPVIIPCHRVVAKNGIGGYSAGIKLKKALLELEGLVFDFD